MLATRINKEGILQLVVAADQKPGVEPRQTSLTGLSELLRRALTPRRQRVKTAVSAAAKRQRLEEKRKRALTKANANQNRMGFMIRFLLALVLALFRRRSSARSHTASVIDWPCLTRRRICSR